MQLAVRGTLGAGVWMAHCMFRRAVGARFGGTAGTLLSLLTAAQFHLPFYMSRTLPNTFALALGPCPALFPAPALTLTCAQCLWALPRGSAATGARRWRVSWSPPSCSAQTPFSSSPQ